MEEAQRLCDRVAIIDRGKLLAIDTVAALIAKHGGSSQIVGEMDDWPKGLEYPGEVEDQTLRFSSERPLESVATLTARGAKFRTLQIRSPDLESVFLSLTGRSLRD